MKRLWIGVLAAAAACGPGEPAEQKALLDEQIEAYYGGLNAEAALHRSEFLADVTPEESQTRGLTYDTYFYHKDKFLLVGVKCQRGECLFKQDVLDYDPAKVTVCDACGAELLAAGLTEDNLAGMAQQRGFSLLRMYEEGAEGVSATVRYVRRRWQWDDRGEIDPGPLDDKGTRVGDRMADVTGPTPGVKGQGFHRPLAEWIGEAVFTYESGKSKITSQKPEVPIRHWAVRDHSYEPPGAGN